MKNFYIAIIIAMIGILALISIKQNIFSFRELPYDSEQEGLQEQIIIHFSHVVAENTPKGMAAAKFAQLVSEKTDGKVIVQVYPNGILYKDDLEFKALQNNDIQMIAPTFSKLSAIDERWLVLDLPFLFANDTQLYEVLNKDIEQQYLQSLEPFNIKGLKIWHNGFKQIAANEQAITSITDFSQLQIRIMKSEVLQEQFSLLGAQPVQTSFDDVFEQLKNQTINSQDNTLSNIYSKGFHTYEKHITLSNHGILGYAVLMNNDFWNSLPKAYQQAVEEALAEMAHWQFTQAVSLNEQALHALEKNEDVKLYELPAAVKQQWIQQLQHLYQRYESDPFYQLLTNNPNKYN